MALTEEQKKYFREYSKKNRDRRREQNYRWRKKNPDKVKAMNRRGGAKYYQENIGMANARAARRRAAMKNSIPQWADIEAIKGIYIKAQQLTEQTGIPHEVDHIYPLQGKNCCGLHVVENLQILTREENRRKHNESPSGVRIFWRGSGSIQEKGT